VELASLELVTQRQFLFIGFCHFFLSIKHPILHISFFMYKRYKIENANSSLKEKCLVFTHIYSRKRHLSLDRKTILVLRITSTVVR